jgi:anti-sigma factor ChrR (cupin superfamily)
VPAELVNADFSRRVVLATEELPWLASPLPGVERRLLDRIGGEVARATSLVRYAPGSQFSAHEHGLGEEFLVLEGVFSDEHGDYPKGTYVRNPPGSRHTPRTAPGCTILVKLRQMRESERQRVVVDTTASPWPPADGSGRSVIHLHSGPDGEIVTLEKLSPGARIAPYALPGGEEIFLLEGDLADEHGVYGPATWVRSPAGFDHELKTTGGAVYWVKRGHLPPSSLSSP